MGLKVYLLGKPDIKVGDVSIQDTFSQKGMALFCFLIANRNKVFYRDTICQMLWSESSDDAARYNLRYNLWLLRKELKRAGVGDELFISSSKGTLQFNSKALYWLDIEVFEKACNGGSISEIEKAINLYQGDFMEGVFLKGCFEFGDWLFLQKERYQSMYFDMLTTLADSYVKRKEYYPAAEYMKKLLSINPLQEEIHRKLMEVLYRAGDRSGAIRQYQRCYDVLRSQLNIGPSEETRALYSRIKSLDGYRQDGGDKSRNSEVMAGETRDISTDVLVIKINCTGKVQYEFMSELIRNVLKEDGKLISQLPPYCIREISAILPELEENRGVNTEKAYPQETFNNRLFYCSLILLEQASLERPIIVEYPGMDAIDQVSRIFIEYAGKRLDHKKVYFKGRCL